MKRVFILLLFAGAALAGPLYIERMTELETMDTTPAEGELVAVVDCDSQTVQVRYGDGATVGGLIVADPYSIKSAYYRQLTRGEYSVVLGGNASVTNGVYQLITRREVGAYSEGDPNTGTLRITPRASGMLLSGVAFGWDSYGAGGSETATPGYVAGATNVLLSAVQTLMPPGDGGTAFYAVSNLAVFGWVGTHLIGATNDCRGNVLLVRDAEADDEALNLGEHNRRMRDHRAEDWSLYAATQTVDMAWQDVELSPYFRITGTARGADIAVTTAGGVLVTNAISIDYMGQACTIVAYSVGSTSVTLWVEASITMTNAPVAQTCTNLSEAAWVDVGAAASWPATSWVTATDGRRFPAWTFTAARTTSPSFYRVLGYPAPATNSVTINLPLVPAAGITLNGTNITSWAELKALLDGMP